MSHRNEPARERRRRKLKDGLSLSSLPLDEKRRLLTVQNHFGWTVMQKCQVGDGNIPKYPQVVQYHEKPDRSGPNYQKITYVVYLNEKEDSFGKKEKEIQTIKYDRVMIDDPRDPNRKIHYAVEEKIRHEMIRGGPLKDHKPRPRDDSPTTAKKKKLLYDFLHKKKDKSTENIFRPIDTEENPLVAAEHFTTDYVPSDKKKPKAEKGRSAPKSWQLRAGAEYTDSDVFKDHIIGESRYFEAGPEQESKLKQNWRTEYDYKYKRSTSKGRAEGEVLWDSNSKTNEYLYVSKETMRNRSVTRR